jgi:formylglycine-generating enzyme required for sulfatase activity
MAHLRVFFFVFCLEIDLSKGTTHDPQSPRRTQGTVNTNTGDTGGGPFAAAGTSSVSVSAFSIGQTEVTWELWNAVKTWAVGAKGYVFANPGRPGGGTTAAVKSKTPNSAGLYAMIGNGAKTSFTT